MVSGVVFQVGERPLHAAQFDVVFGRAVKAGFTRFVPFAPPVNDTYLREADGGGFDVKYQAVYLAWFQCGQQGCGHLG